MSKHVLPQPPLWCLNMAHASGDGQGMGSKPSSTHVGWGCRTRHTVSHDDELPLQIRSSWWRALIFWVRGEDHGVAASAWRVSRRLVIDAMGRLTIEVVSIVCADAGSKICTERARGDQGASKRWQRERGWRCCHWALGLVVRVELTCSRY